MPQKAVADEARADVAAVGKAPGRAGPVLEAVAAPKAGPIRAGPALEAVVHKAASEPLPEDLGEFRAE